MTEHRDLVWRCTLTTLLTLHALVTVSMFALLLAVMAGQGAARLVVGVARRWRRRDTSLPPAPQDVRQGARSH